MRHLVVAVCVLLAAGCDPDVCGTVEIRGVASHPDIDRYDEGMDGDLDLAELCGTSYGAFASDRPDYMFTTLVLDADVPDYDTEGGFAITDVVLPAGSVVFLTSHLVAGTTIPITQLAGSALHKQSYGSTYQLYALTAGTVTILEGPDNREEFGVESEQWSDEWRVSWDLDFGNGTQRWIGTDTIVRHDGDTIGTPVHVPPDYRP